ncbi:MAG: F0F1 ATP synthase subunit delta, partial [Elusimicrobiaceae bacterium]|nr:F0F1 ATP synthase subunit delta [Elusimicrobiaceae bacterium]
MNSSQRLAVVRYAAAYDAMSTSLTIAQENAIQLQRATKILEGVRDAMQSPRVSTAHKKLVLQETLKDVPVALSFILVLLDAKRYGLLPAICEQVQTLLDDRKGISRAIVS